MSSFSGNTSTLCFQTHKFSSTYLKCSGLYNIHKPQLSFHPKLAYKIKLHASFKPSNFFKLFAFPNFPDFHNSCIEKATRSTNLPIPVKSSHRFLFEKVAILLIGSFVLMECLGRRPVLALPSLKTRVEEKLEKKNKTQDKISEELEMCLNKNPRDVDALKVLVYGFLRKGKTKEAVAYLERLIDVDPSNVEWRLLQATCYETMGHLSKAKRLFKEILQEKPLLLRALHGLAMVMHKNHEGNAVFEMLTEALRVAYREKRRTEERSIKILIAQMHVVKGQLDDALKKFEILIEENPRDFRPYLCQGIVYSLLEKEKEAKEVFEIYRSLVPEEFPQRGFLDDVVLTAKTTKAPPYAKTQV